MIVQEIRNWCDKVCLKQKQQSQICDMSNVLIVNEIWNWCDKLFLKQKYQSQICDFLMWWWWKKYEIDVIKYVLKKTAIPTVFFIARLDDQ